MPFLAVEGVRKSFGATVALDGASLSAESSEIHGIIGENGSGKSTLMRIVAGVMKPEAGSFLLDGKPFHPRSPMDARRAGISMIHQELSICGHLSVAENIVLGVEDSVGGFLEGSTIRRRARQALGSLGYPDLDVELPAGSLPLAVRQIVEIARAVAQNARLVILDEPTSSLTESDVQRLFSAMRKLKENGATVLYISHFLNEIREICDRMTVLRDGQTVGTSLVEGLGDEEIVKMLVGRPIEEMYPRSPRAPGDAILSTRELSGREKPKGVDLELRRGEVYGIAGLNGSGRSELLRTIFGLDRVASGEVRIGLYQGPHSPAERWREGVGLLSENRKEEGLMLNQSIAENTTLASLRGIFVSPVKQESSAETWIDKLAIRCREPGQRVGELSGGNQQKVAIARMLQSQVDVLLLDEPTKGIDVGSKEQIYRLIDELAVNDKAVLMVSSYLPELLGTCDRISVMNRGRLSKPMAAREANQEQLMEIAVSG